MMDRKEKVFHANMLKKYQDRNENVAFMGDVDVQPNNRELHETHEEGQSG